MAGSEREESLEAQLREAEEGRQRREKEHTQERRDAEARYASDQATNRAESEASSHVTPPVLLSTSKAAQGAGSMAFIFLWSLCVG